MDDVKIEIEKIEYLNVLIQDCKINDHLGKLLNPSEIFDFDYKVEATDFYNLNESLIKVVISIIICVKASDQNVYTGASFVIDNYFRYSDLKKFTSISQSKVLVEFELSSLFKNLSYSTARGVIVSEVFGTLLEKAVLPIIMPKYF